MRQVIEQAHQLDGNGNPAGGETKGLGISIRWQDGPLVKGYHSEPVDPLGAPGQMRTVADRAEPNGAFVEGVIQAAIGRIQHYQSGKFNCRENALALTKLEEALHWLDHRTRDRETRKVEGTHAV
jgi:hypothetical protein